jgi:hypothetical protein
VAQILERSDNATEAENYLARSFLNCDVVVNAAGLATPGAPSSAELFGANAVLPLVIARAAERSAARRFVHLSSAAVQGNRAVLDESHEVSPFSPYSMSKSLGEQALAAWNERNQTSVSIVTVRATSVQGEGRPTTIRLRRLAKLPIASVAAPGTQPTPVSSAKGLATFVGLVGAYQGKVPTIVLQPWEGMTTESVLRLASGRKPLVLPASLCRLAIRIGYTLGRATGGRLNGAVRRLELMWFGQAQDAAWSREVAPQFPHFVADVLASSQVVATRETEDSA